MAPAHMSASWTKASLFESEKPHDLTAPSLTRFLIAPPRLRRKSRSPEPSITTRAEARRPSSWRITCFGAELEEHSRRKHKILREYFFQYITVRCQLPQQERLRLAVIDGFAGGGRYKCGTSGSPLTALNNIKQNRRAWNHALGN
jgi:hypothetical protein